MIPWRVSQSSPNADRRVCGTGAEKPPGRCHGHQEETNGVLLDHECPFSRRRNVARSGMENASGMTNREVNFDRSHENTESFRVWITDPVEPTGRSGSTSARGKAIPRTDAPAPGARRPRGPGALARRSLEQRTRTRPRPPSSCPRSGDALIDRERPVVRDPPAAPQPGLHRGGRDLAGAGHRRQRRHLPADRRHPAALAAGARSPAAADDRFDRRRLPQRRLQPFRWRR